jgi:hypothetical protein
MLGVIADPQLVDGLAANVVNITIQYLRAQESTSAV